MQRAALYYPYIHIRDDNWLKAASLYWPSVRRIVPQGYPKHDSRTAEAFAEEGVLRDVDPGWRMDRFAVDLASAIHTNIDEVANQYGLLQAYGADNHAGGRHKWEPWQNAALAWIHFQKIPRRLIDLLVDSGVAVRGRGQVHKDEHLILHGQLTRPEDWIGMHPALASAYMTALAGEISDQSSFEPLTDQTDLRVATPNHDVRAALSLLLGQHANRDRAASADGIETYVMLALQQVVPVDLDQITAEQIIECRNKLAQELTDFRTYVDGMQQDLLELAQIPDDIRRIEAFTEQVQETVEQPLRNLERGMNQLKVPTVRELFVSTLLAPTTAASLTHAGATPATAFTAGTAVVVGNAWWSIHEKRSALKKGAAVGYLLDVRSQLTPKTALGRARDLVIGT
ncbi:DUF6236 family protein [Nocardioides sp. NPDC127503]|uniref:DUF6236 family protein n=1 Tax=Nocardioides sp. NPDC127503 TaxID=3154516 RepID=UPI003333E47C